MAESLFKNICIASSLTIVYIFGMVVLLVATALSTDKKNLIIIQTSTGVIVLGSAVMLFLLLAFGPTLRSFASEEEAEEEEETLEPVEEVVIDIDSAAAVCETRLKPNCEIREVSENDDEESEECCICLAGSEEDKVWVILKNCKHMFHCKCLSVWLVSKESCPICRDPVTHNS